MTPDPNTPITIAGAGLAGCLLGILLARQGWRVDILEKRPDPRQRGYEGGRSINLALAERGLHGLRLAGLKDVVMRQAVRMRGRMVHFVQGHTELQPYGRDEREVIWSVHRGRLNIALLDAAEAAGVGLHFNRRIQSVDFGQNALEIVSDLERSAASKRFAVLIGADGAGSAVRQAINAVTPLGERWESLGHSYKELEIPPSAGGGFRIEPEALHIWPRGGHMCIALPNTEGTFTVTLFLPNEGEPSFAGLRGVGEARAFFAREFADALALIPDFERDFVDNPTSPLSTLYLDRWHLGGQAVLLGDAAHAMVPFHGQGMNCAFEDCVALAERIAAGTNFASAFAAFEAERAPNALAIQQMALDNYIEMRDRVDDPDYRLQRQLELLLANRHPERFVPRYSQVMFQRVPYAEAQAAGRRQRALLEDLTRGRERLEQIDLAAADAAVARL
jgi:kynurenine 3-monooxygenase